MTLFIWFLIAEVINLIYIKLTYSGFKNAAISPLVAMLFGCFNQFLWTQVVKISESHTQITVLSVVWDCLGFLTWALIPLFFYSSKFSLSGVVGLGLISTGIILVGLQK